MSNSIEPSHSSQDTSSSDEVQSEDFDFLVVASGYFARPYIPHIPGLEKFTGKVVHSSTIRKGRHPIVHNDNDLSGNVVVIGGSMSGVEAASAAALSQSSALVESDSTSLNKPKASVHHIHSRPFWTLPTYPPRENADDTISFLPLDLAMYDLGRRPPGPIEYAIGPISAEKAAKTNAYFSSLLGSEYEEIGHIHSPRAGDETMSRPPWVAIGNEYAEFVRSRAITTTMGRVVSVDSRIEARVASIDIEKSDGGLKTIDNVSVLVMATGFTPFDSLSFLSADVLSALEYSEADPFLPLVLDQGGTLRSEMEEIGFVGFYRGPYWGVMEMQARFLGQIWANRSNTPQATHSQRHSLRILRDSETEPHRGQFPMGDYVGLMESFARTLGLNRAEVSVDDIHAGPVVPSRYAFRSQRIDDAEIQRTLNALRSTYAHDNETTQAAAAMAIFRALQGTWKFTRWSDEPELTGVLVYRPCYPSDPAYDREYIGEEYSEPSGQSSEHLPKWTSRSILRLSEGCTTRSTSRIEIHSLSPSQKAETGLDGYALDLTPLYREKENGEAIPGRYVIYASSSALTGSGDPQSVNAKGRYLYTFHFDGVSVTSWECIDRGQALAAGNGPIESQTIANSRTLFER